MPTVPVRATARPLSQLLSDLLRAWFEPLAEPQPSRPAPARRLVPGTGPGATGHAAFRPVARPLPRASATPRGPLARLGGPDPYASLDVPTYQRRGMRIEGLPAAD